MMVLGQSMGLNKNENINKNKNFYNNIFYCNCGYNYCKTFCRLTFKKKFSVRPVPGVIVKEVQKSQFYKSIETFGTAIAQNSKTYRIKKDDVIGNLRIENRFVKKGEIIAALKNSNNIIADFSGKLGKREIAQGSFRIR